MKIIMRWKKKAGRLLKPFLKKVDVIVIIPCFNEAESIYETIQSLHRQTRKPDHIIVGDDRSTDDTRVLAQLAGAQVITHNEKSGNKAFNQKAIIESDIFKKLVEGKSPNDIVVVVIDGDTIIDEKGIELLIEPFENDLNTMSASGYVIPQERKTYIQKSRLVEYHFSLNLHKSVQNEFGMNLVVSGCFCAIRYSTILHHGFDTRTITEDFGLTCSQHLNNEKILFIKKAICYTKEPSTFNMWIRQLDRWYRGFFQNVFIYRKGIYEFKNKKFTILIGFLFLEGLLEFLIPLILLILYQLHMRPNISHYWYFTVLLEFLIMFIPASVGSIRHNQFWETTLSIPYFWSLRFVAMYMFWRSFTLEWIFKRKLNVWNKGH